MIDFSKTELKEIAEDFIKVFEEYHTKIRHSQSHYNRNCNYPEFFGAMKYFYKKYKGEFYNVHKRR